MNYTPQLLPRRDSLGNLLNVGVIYDEQTKTFVGEIRMGRLVKMVSGAMRKPIVAIGEASTPNGAADDALKNFLAKRH